MSLRLTDDADPTPSGWPGGNGLRRWSVWCGVCSLTGGDVMSDEKFLDSAEREIFAAAMEARNRQCPWDSPDEVAGRAWAMVLEYRSRCPGNDGCPTVEEAAGNDGGPTESDLLGDVQHVADYDKWVHELASEIEWEPLRNFVLRLKPEADLRGEVDHG